MPEKAGQYGHVQPLRDAYRQCMDYAFQQVFTGATDYNTAIRQATKNLADMGVRVIDYESGVHTSLEAAVRRNIMGGLGLMQEQISQQNHDEMGANGWEINAHAASAPDHEPIQGRQYNDEAFKRLNGSLKRRIGTLNCGHAVFPIILGVSEPQYSPAELEAMRQQNAKGVTIEGRHYSLYEATQMQRKMERSIRKQKKRILVDKATGDEEKLQIDQTKLRMQNANYKKFSDAAGLRTQRERTFVAGVGRKEAEEASRAPKLPSRSAGRPSLDGNQRIQSNFSGTSAPKAFTNGGGSGIITSNRTMERRKSPERVEPMPKRQFQRIEKAFKRQGGVFQYGAETDTYLASKNAEAMTYNAKTILLKQNPGRASVFEELIHATQYRTGQNDGTYESRIRCEIEAQKKLLKYSSAYKLTDAEIRQTQSALKSYEAELKAYQSKEES